MMNPSSSAPPARPGRSPCLAAAVTACLLGTRLAAAQNAPPAVAPSSGKLDDIVVTATRRAENLQEVPIAITALTGETLGQLNVVTFDDYLRYVPSLSAAGKGPGQSEVYMRGLATTQAGNQGAGAIGSFPNVAVYLDDQSVQLPGRNLDIYSADLERIEVLEGPQGTLYGAGAQAGAVRYITNKPKLNTLEVNLSAGHEVTAHGDPSNSIEAVVNLSLIPDTLALRVVVYDDKRGAYIHNIPGTFTRLPTDLGIVSYFAGVVPPGPSVSNASLVTPSYNPTEYKGGRASALWHIADDWDLLIQQSYQDLRADGVYAYDPSLGDLNVQQYNPSGSHDKYTDTAWTLNGRIGNLKAVYTGGFLDRHEEQTTDYTAYARGYFSAYYQCDGPSIGAFTGYYNNVSPTDVCYSPSATWYDNLRNTHLSHELRLSTPDDARVRAVGGLFYEDFKIQDSINFQYAQQEAGFYPYAPLPGTTTYDPSVRKPGTAFFDDITRGYKQKAAFGEVAFDLLPKALTLTLGTRFYSMDTYERGSNNSAYGCRGIPQCETGSSSLDLVTFADGTTGPLQKTFSGHKSKANLSWKFGDSKLLYFTYSEGFRPGGFNRGQGVINPGSPLYGKFTVPTSFDTDNLKNFELGWKTTWLDHTLQFNGAIYEEKWSSVQLDIFDPTLYGNQLFTTNGPDYRVRGLEGELVWKANDHLTLTSSFAWNSSAQVNDPQLVGNDGNAVSLFPTAGIGSPLAQAPPFQGNLRARYEFRVGDFDAHWQVAAQHTGHSFASVITVGGFEPPNQPQEPYTTYDASAGLSRGPWSVELYGQNLSDTRAQLYVNGFDSVHVITINRPRTFGLKVRYHLK
jgi:iron complex outermembrane receptor protein